MSTSPAPRASASSNLRTRLLTAAVVVPLLLVLLYLGPAWGWWLLLFVASGVGAVELFRMTHAGDAVAQAAGVLLTMAWSAILWRFEDHPRVLIVAASAMPIAGIGLTLARLGDVQTTALRMAATAFGPLWIGLLTLLALVRRDHGPDGPGWAMLAIQLAWLADTGGYFAGRFLGRTKLYPAVSPNKTVEGLFGAIGGALFGALFGHYYYAPALPLADAIALAVLAGTLGQVGDLGESLLKRATGVKDSGGIVPGHGGILDRVDALFVTSAVVYAYTALR